MFSQVKFEYKITDIELKDKNSTFKSFETVQFELNQLGRDGWDIQYLEYRNLGHSDASMHLVLKRGYIV